MSYNLTNLFYLVTIVTFILARRFLSSPAHARREDERHDGGEVDEVRDVVAH